MKRMRSLVAVGLSAALVSIGILMLPAKSLGQEAAPTLAETTSYINARFHSANPEYSYEISVSGSDIVFEETSHSVRRTSKMPIRFAGEVSESRGSASDSIFIRCNTGENCVGQTVEYNHGNPIQHFSSSLMVYPLVADTESTTRVARAVRHLIELSKAQIPEMAPDPFSH
jgi:hypothetical protein